MKAKLGQTEERCHRNARGPQLKSSAAVSPRCAACLGQRLNPPGTLTPPLRLENVLEGTLMACFAPLEGGQGGEAPPAVASRQIR